MRAILLPLITMMLMFGSCMRYAYYQSPLHTNTASYKAMPMVNDHMKAATYASAALSAGAANDHLTDNLGAFFMSVHRANRLGSFQAYYGVSGTLGYYKVDSIFESTGLFGTRLENRNLDDAYINNQAGRKFFGSWGINGGINAVIPFPFIEWRIIGAEFSYTREFGKYFQFRRSLPDTAANIIARGNELFTIALTTDLIFQTRHEMIGFKISMVQNPHTLKGYASDRSPIAFKSSYLSQTFHVQIDRVTGYIQLNTGNHALAFQAGSNVRLGH